MALKFACENSNRSTSLTALLDNVSTATNPSGPVTLYPVDVLINAGMEFTFSNFLIIIILMSTTALCHSRVCANVPGIFPERNSLSMASSSACFLFLPFSLFNLSIFFL
ncbi:uncharacterized protein METZ01_LOCUS506637 [marine metagenome]|uniref:Uncharacterized protein n=1 Tax=marine metagenome TaxID=408172 RepID=A0A383EBK9_9ZZZZ